MNAKQREHADITERQMRTVRLFWRLRPDARPILPEILEAIVAGEGVAGTAAALFRANGDPDQEAVRKAAEMVERVGARS